MKRFFLFVAKIAGALCLAAASFMVPAASVSAATLTGVSDVVSSLQIGVGADHRFTFTTPTGITAMNTFGFTFGDAPGEFAVSVSSFSLTVNGSSKTVGAGLCPSADFVQEVTNNQVTFRSCNSVAAGSTLVVSLLGQLLRNPSTPGTHYVTIGGGFGDSASIALPISATSDQVNVSATVVSSCGNSICDPGETTVSCPADCHGGGGGGNPISAPDTSSPSITDITVSSVTATSATVTWTTSVDASSRFDYGPTTAYASGPVLDSSFLSAHTVSLSGLTQGVTYHFSILATGINGHTATSVDQTFATTDTVPPVISSIQVTNIGQNSATMVWTTDEPATSLVEYGKTVSYGSAASDPSLVSSHQVALTGLTFGTTYHFRVRSSDASLNEATSADGTFDTLANPPPGNVSGLTATPGDARNTLVWVNPSDEDLVGVRVVACTGAYPSGPTDARAGCSVVFDALGTTVVQNSLVNHTTYFYGVYAKDSAGQYSTGALVSARPDGPPGPVSGLVINRGNGQLLLSWHNPTEQDLAAVRVVACTGGYPTGPADTANGCVVASETLTTTYTRTGLTNGTTYYFGVYAKDASNLFSSGITGSGVPTAIVPPPGPVVSLLAVSGDRRVALSWHNPSDDDLAAIEVLSCTNGLPSSPDDSSGCVVLLNQLGTSVEQTGLTNGTTVYYGVYARNTNGQYSIGAFTTGTPSAAQPVCGDGTCNGQETPSSCAIDCGTTGSICGNTVCEMGETSALCPADCGLLPSCGNGLCETGETSDNCPADCPSIPSPTAPSTLKADDVSIVANGVRIPPQQQTFDVLAGAPVTFEISADRFSTPPESVRLVLGPQTYNMTRQANADGTFTYRSDVPLPAVSGSVATAVVVQEKDGTIQTLSLVSNIQGLGLVYEVVDGKTVPVSGAVVTLLEGGTGRKVWDGTPFGEENPHLTGANGSFGWYVPKGLYRIRVEKGGYDTVTTKTFSADNRLAIDQIALHVSLPLLPAIVNTVQEIQQSPVAQQAAVSTTPVVVAVAVANTASLAVGFNLLSYLQYLSTAPVLLFSRRKRKGYGMVYNAITKVPVDLAIVRLYRIDETNPSAMGQLVSSRVTDKGGRYFFLAQPGTYRLVAVKTGFAYPSTYLGGVKDDGLFLDVYHSEPIQVTGASASIAANIPLDPAETTETPKSIKWKKALRGLQNGIAIVGNIGAIGVFALRPSVFTAVMAGGQFFVYALVRRLASPHKPVNWGIVYDRRTGRPLANTIARIFEPKYNKLLETAVTDARGRFTFLLGPNEYYAVFSRDGFEPFTLKPIDYSKRTEPTDLSEKIGLTPVSPAQTMAPPMPPPAPLAAT